MKKIILLVLLIFIISSCEEGSVIPPNGSITSDTLMPLTPDICGRRVFEVEFDDLANDNGHYYILLLKEVNKNGYKTYSSFRIYNKFSLNVTVPIYYFDGLAYSQMGIYELMVYKYKLSDFDKLGDPAFAIGSAGPFPITISPFADYSTLYNQCCNNSRSRYKAQAVKDIGSLNIDKVKADITTRYGVLCGEYVSSTQEAMSAAWIGLQRENGVFAPYMQFGYMQYRQVGSTTTNKILYVEYIDLITLDTVRPIILEPAPSDGTEHLYEIEFDPSDGSVFFSYDNILVHNWTYLQWMDSAAYRYVLWAGEIEGYETDMTGSDTLTFENCGYSVLGYDNYDDANFQFNTDITSHDPDQWKFGNGNNNFWIWDTFRL